jgi:hypothetical protein
MFQMFQKVPVSRKHLLIYRFLAFFFPSYSGLPVHHWNLNHHNRPAGVGGRLIKPVVCDVTGIAAFPICTRKPIRLLPEHISPALLGAALYEIKRKLPKITSH